MAEKNQCPICKRPAVADHKPFCSRRCADLDLGRWLNEAYAIPATEQDEEDDGLPEDADDAPPRPN